MKTLVNRIVVLAAGALVLGTMAYGQTEMKAHIPFAFRTATSTLPAGDYTVGRYNLSVAAPVATLENDITLHKVFAPGGSNDAWKGGSPMLTFRCTDDGGCVLAAIRTPYGALIYKTGHKTARDKEAAFISIPLRPVNAD